MAPMTYEILNRIRQWFEQYSAGFAESDGQLHELLQLKVDHSRRVARDAQALATDLDWPSEDVNLAESLGWLHDIGRFTQFKEYRTFHDAESFDHGERAWQILQQDSVLSGTSDSDRMRVLMGVRWHNAKQIPPDLETEAYAGIRLIRDADKLDIYRVLLKRLKVDGFRAIAEMFPHVKLDGPVNPELIDDFRMCRSSSFKNVKSLNDFLIMALAWIYDINYAVTFRFIMERDILSELIAHLPADDGQIPALIDQAEGYVRSRL